MAEYIFDDPKEQELFDSVFNGLRDRGWNKTDAEDEAWDKVYKRRARLALGFDRAEGRS